MTQNVADNPANRLLVILQECKAIPPNENCRAAWQKVLKTTDEAALLNRMAKALNLSREVVDVVEEAFPRHVPPIQKLRSQICAGFSQQNMNGDWSAFTSQITDDSIVAIGFAASLLEEREKFRTVASDNLAAQRDRLVELRKEVVASIELPEEVRLTIARYLGRLIDSFDEYFITGIFPVLDAANMAIGNLAFDQEYNHALRDTEVGKRVTDALANIANSVTIVAGMIQFSEPLHHLLQMLPPV
ncbi:hypothetical protein [Caballeronia sp. GAFFF2]|uniref:hypothetical protein n=1 Tax=Caballeronia sp. GAFFF2 TaxID=2921741 RepID=UPI0020295F00|nr:hypothetical protein [Caballeronia sp. GAFFF2]